MSLTYLCFSCCDARGSSSDSSLCFDRPIALLCWGRPSQVKVFEWYLQAKNFFLLIKITIFNPKPNMDLILFCFKICPKSFIIAMRIFFFNIYLYNFLNDILKVSLLGQRINLAIICQLF